MSRTTCEANEGSGASPAAGGSPWFPHGQPYPLVLASSSPRRREVLSQVGLRFIQAVSDADETWPAGVPPDEAVKQLALRKTLAVAPDYSEGIIIGADTAVILRNVPLGKPASEEEAFSMLRRLAGAKHSVLTGIALIDITTGARVVEAESTEVWMRRATDDELRAYAASGEPADKAGAYGIQGLGAGLVTKIEGCYFNVVGLPITRLITCLQRLVITRGSQR